MKNILNAVVILLAALSCRNAAGPSQGQTPGGEFIVWFNGLSANAGAYFPDADSLVAGAWTTGSAPNQIREMEEGRFAVLSSMAADLRVYSGENAGATEKTILFPQGSNPYGFTLNGVTGWATLMLTGEVAVFSLDTGGITGTFPVESNPSGIEFAGGMLFVSHGSFPDPSSPGGVSVIDPASGQRTAWLDTGVNTHWIRLQPSGMLHCNSTTYADDGRITVIDPATLETVCVIECGGAPGEAVQTAGGYLSPDGWGQGGGIIYSEQGDHQRVSLPFSPTGLALHQGILYATSFGRSKVYLLDEQDYTLLDSLSSGGEGPQGIIAVPGVF